MSQRLAIHGGPRVVPDGAMKPWPIITEDDVTAVSESLRSGILWGSNSPQAVALSKEWADYCGVKFCVCINSATAAMHAGLQAAGVGPGDEVIVPAYSFYSTAYPPLHQNAIPVFVDIDRRTYNMDPDDTRANITERTKAIIVTHLSGLCADMDLFMKLAEEHHFLVIEDAAQAHGAVYKGRRAGSLAHVGAFSLNGSKNLPGGEGGFFTTDCEEWAEKAYDLGITVRFKDGVRSYPERTFGFSHRMDEMTAALIRSQLRRLDEYNRIRRDNAARLSAGLSQIEGLIVPYEPPGYEHVYHMYRVRFDFDKLGVDTDRLKARKCIEDALLAEGVDVGQWMEELIPQHHTFQSREGYGKGCPWTCKHAARDISYDADRFREQYPEALSMIESSAIVWGIHPPNGPDLMDAYIEGFAKVFGAIESVLSGAGARA